MFRANPLTSSMMWQLESACRPPLEYPPGENESAGTPTPESVSVRHLPQISALRQLTATDLKMLPSLLKHLAVLAPARERSEKCSKLLAVNLLFGV